MSTDDNNAYGDLDKSIILKEDFPCQQKLQSMQIMT